MYVLNLVVQVFCSDIISDEPTLHLKCLHIYKPTACKNEYKDE